jgi:hypothetical protein
LTQYLRSFLARRNGYRTPADTRKIPQLRINGTDKRSQANSHTVDGDLHRPGGASWQA